MKDAKYFDSLIENNDLELLKEELFQEKPADIADYIENTSQENKIVILKTFPNEKLADIVIHLEENLRSPFLKSFAPSIIAKIIAYMEPDDAADFISEIEEDKLKEEIIANLKSEFKEKISQLLSFHEDSAGAIMTTEFCAMPEDITVQEALRSLKRRELKDPVMYIYLVNPVNNVLLGAVNLVNVIKADLHTKLKELMENKIIWTSTDGDKDKIAQDFRHYGLWAMPVVNDQHQLVGRITVDDILDVTIQGAYEDMAQMTGTIDLIDHGTKVFDVVKLRLPWLIMTMILAFVNSYIIERTLSTTTIAILIVFPPVIMAMGGNTGLQSATIIIRQLALNNKFATKLIMILRKEIIHGLVMGVICGILAGITVFFVVSSESISSIKIAYILFLSIFSAMTFSALFGAFIPVLLDKVKIDPAVAAGPFVTTLNDITSSLIYFLVCYLLV